MPPMKINEKNMYNKNAATDRTRHSKAVEGGVNMESVWAWLASLIYEYGKFGAGMASIHGGYEGAVPTALRELQK